MELTSFTPSRNGCGITCKSSQRGSPTPTVSKPSCQTSKGSRKSSPCPPTRTPSTSCSRRTLAQRTRWTLGSTKAGPTWRERRRPTEKKCHCRGWELISTKRQAPFQYLSLHQAFLKTIFRKIYQLRVGGILSWSKILTVFLKTP